MASDSAATDVRELANTRARRRAEDYRERAAQFRKMAGGETIDRVRDTLLRLAEQYDGLAARIGPAPYVPEKEVGGRLGRSI